MYVMLSFPLVFDSILSTMDCSFSGQKMSTTLMEWPSEKTVWSENNNHWLHVCLQVKLYHNITSTIKFVIFAFKAKYKVENLMAL